MFARVMNVCVCSVFIAYEADALPTELPRQLSWLGRIKAIQGKGNQSNLT